MFMGGSSERSYKERPLKSPSPFPLKYLNQFIRLATIENFLSFSFFLKPLKHRRGAKPFDNAVEATRT